MELKFIPKEEFDRIKSIGINLNEKLALIAKMCRLNTLTEVKKAGSGHLGSSLSAMDIVVFLYYHYLNIKDVGIDSPDRDIYFSSKGHDVPGFYSVLYSFGIIPEDKFLNLRKLNGLDGHPFITHPGIEANTGSLGMGISKAKGMSYAKKYLKRKGRVFVLTGDGEFQEGQNFEALQSAIQQNVTNITVVMDHNKLQSDRPIDKIVNLGDFENKVKAFGWHVSRCDGHDFDKIEYELTKFDKITDKPKFLICDTIKGKGISFMEHPEALKNNNGLYKWHSGAPNDEDFNKAFNEIYHSLENDYQKLNLGILQTKSVIIQDQPSFKADKEFVSISYGKALVDLAEKNKDFVVLDADLSGDCKTLEFEQKYPERFIECGIAEQDMVSMAGGLALQGLIPIVNSFASFLASRSNEQIYNNLTENKKVIYACHYAGLIPAGPGSSHQSLRDISLIGANPNCIIFQATNGSEMRMFMDYAINKSQESCMIRIPIGPSPKTIQLPDNYKLEFGKGIKLTEGEELVLIGYGPVMLNEALIAEEQLRKKSIKLKVISLPWINRFDLNWIEENLEGCKKLFILEDHYPFGGLGDFLIDFFIKNNLIHNFDLIQKLAVDKFPAYGSPKEVLRYHGLDGISIFNKIKMK